MPEGINISSGINQGEAQIFERGINTTDALQYAIGEKRRKDAEEQARQKAAQKAVTDIYDTVDEVNVTGYLPHVNYLTKQKDNIRGYLTKNYVETKGKYNPATDPVVGKLMSNLKKENQMSTQIKEYAKQLPSMLTKENSKNYTDESILEVDKFLKLPLDQQVQYVEKNGSYPLPQPKPEVIDYDKNIDDIAKNLAEKSTTVEKTKAEGGTETITSSGFDPKDVELYAKSYVTAGLEGRRPDAANLLQSTRKKLEKDIVFQAMSEEDQAKKVAQEAEKYVSQRMKAQDKRNFSKTEQGVSKGLTMNFGGGGNSAENDQVRVVVKDTDDDKRIYSIAQIKGTENSSLEFSLPDGKIIKGTPLRIEKNKKTGGKNVIISVPEMIDQSFGTGKYRVTKKVPSGKTVEKKVPYSTNEDRIFKGKFKFTTDEIDKGMTESGVDVKSSSEKKHTIKGKEYSESAVKKAADASGMTIEEYIKEANQ